MFAIKTTRILALVALCAAFLFIPAAPVRATDRHYAIAQYTVYLHILQDGSVHVEELLTYRFVGAFNGIHLRIDSAGHGQPQGLTVSVLNPQHLVRELANPTHFTQVPSAQIGDSGVFTLDMRNNLTDLQIFYPATDQYVAFLITYTLPQGAWRLLDTGYLSRTVLGANWDVPIEEFTAIVRFAAPPMHVAGARIYYHDGMGVRVEPVVPYRTIITSRNVPPGQTIHIDALFPVAALPDAPPHPYTLEEFRAMLARGGGVPLFVWFIIAGVVALIGWVTYRSWPHPTQFRDRFFRELPADHGPALMAYLVRHTVLDARDMAATLFHLAQRGVLVISEETQFDGTPDHRFALTGSTLPTGLRPHETYLLEWLLQDLGHGTAVTMSQIAAAGAEEESAEHFRNHFNEWMALVKQEAADLDYYEGIWRRTPHAQEEFKKWKAFRRYIKEEVPGLIAQEQPSAMPKPFIPYAISLGVADKVLPLLPHTGDEYVLPYTLLVGGFTTAHTNAASHADDSSSSTSSTSVSGGGAGGGGGAF